MKSQTFKLASWNVNGIRACLKKGFWDWLDRSQTDIVCLQETKITEKDFLKLANEHGLIPLHEIKLEQNTNTSLRSNPENNQLDLLDRHVPQRGTRDDTQIFFALAPAKKPGYSGTLLLSRIRPQKIEIGLDEKKFDDEGRTLIAHFDHFVLFNCYFPNSGPELARLPFKLEYNDCLLEKIQGYRKKFKNIVITGDFNVAHEEIDIKNPKSNENNAGFTQAERDWFSKLLSKKYIDTFRKFYPNKRDMYTWWSYRFNARQRNIGWRIDYFVTTQELLPHLKSANIDMARTGSDHCPIGLQLAFSKNN